MHDIEINISELFLLNSKGLAEPYVSRRIRALETQIPRITKRRCNKSPSLNIAQMIVVLNARSDMELFNTHYMHTSHVVGAVIWILDEIKQAGKYEKLFDIVSNLTGYEAINADINDSVHPTEIINKLVYIFHNIYDSNFDIIPSESMCERVPVSFYNNMLEEILALVPCEDIELSILNFEQWVNYCINRFLDGGQYHIGNSNKFLDSLNKFGDILGNNTPSMLNSCMALATPFQPISTYNSTSSLKNCFKAKSAELREEAQAASTEFNDFCNTIVSSNTLFSENLSQKAKENFNDVYADILIDLQHCEGDPYEFCFAYMYMICNGYDTPWMYPFSSCVLNSAVSMLPWAFVKKHAEYNVDMRNLTDGQNKIYEPPFSTSKITAAQMLFAMTGYIAPRTVIDEESLVNIGLSTHLSEQTALAITMLNNIEHKKSAEQFLVHRENDEPELNSTSISNLSNENNSLRAQVKRLNAEIHNLHKELSKATETLSQKEEDFEQDRKSLADLREILFNRDNNIDDNEDNSNETDIAFPYETHQRIIVFGGHDSWLRSIRQKLPNVRFVGDRVAPELVKNQDIVWLQTYAMNHPAYYRIIDLCKNNKIPFRHLSSKGVYSCARQIIQFDQQPHD